MIDKNLNWPTHSKLVEGKFLKNIVVLFKGDLHMNIKCLSMIYFSFIHSHINYGNIAWASISQTKLKKILNKNMLFELYFMKKKKIMQDS